MSELAFSPWPLVFCLGVAGCADEHSGAPSPDPGSTGDGGSSAAGVGGTVGAGGSGFAPGGAAGAAGETCSAPEAKELDVSCSEDSSIFASELVDHSFGPGQDVGQEEFPDLVFGPPRGAGENQGATSDVVSLGNGGWVVLAFRDNAIVDGPGADFIVFENAFRYGADGERVFAELATVSVSQDGEDWVDFPCTESAAPYGYCAGWHPVLANADDAPVEELDPEVVGGDPYDLEDVCLEYARFVRITDRADLDSSLDGVFDLDAVGIVNGACGEP